MPKANNKILFFKNITDFDINKKKDEVSLTTLYLASSVDRECPEYRLAFSEFYISKDRTIFSEEKEKMIKYLSGNEFNCIIISLLEDYIIELREVIKIIRQYSHAFILVGGLMPTLSPKHVFYNLPEADFLIRGEGVETLPELLKILENKNIGGKFYSDDIQKLNKINGLVGRINGDIYENNLAAINYINDFKLEYLNFELFGQENFIDGLKLFSSRGCMNCCSFCTSYVHGRYLSYSYVDLINCLDKYSDALKGWFGELENVPERYFKVSFYDDDFLADRKRAIAFFDFIRKHQYFYIGFFQTGIKSFFIYKDGQCTDEMDMDLLNSIDSDVFKRDQIAKDDHFIYLGTENFCDKELIYLNKGYDFQKIKKVIEELSKRKIYQAHHFMFSNIYTTFDDVFENLTKIFVLHQHYSPYFQILFPIIENLISYFNTPIYQKVKNNADLQYLDKSSIGQGESEYVLVKKDIPKDKIVRNLSGIINEISGDRFNNFIDLFERIFLYILYERERLFCEADDKEKKEKLTRYEEVIKKYGDYRGLMQEKEREYFGTDIIKNVLYRCNSRLVVIITHLCQLNCSYCFVRKYNSSISERDLYRAINLLFVGDRKNMQLQFFGGEPLLKFDLLKKAIFYSQSLNIKYKKNLSYLLTTNGLLLDSKIARFLSKYKVVIELSIDGDYDTVAKMNKKNVLAKKTFERLIENIDLLNKYRVNYYVIMVVNPENADKMIANFQYLKKNKAEKIQVNYAAGMIWPKEKFDLYLKNFSYLYNNYGNIMQLNREPILFNSELMLDSTGDFVFVDAFFLKPDEPERFRQFILGNLKDNKKLNHYSTNRFLSYQFLADRLSDQERRLFFNNIVMGIKVHNLIHKDHWLNA